MRKLLLPLVIGELCASDSCFCITRVGTYFVVPQAKTAFFSIGKLKRKINRDTKKWAKRALIASAVIGGGVIAYRFAPVIKSRIKTLAIRLGIIKPPVVKSRWEKFGDYVKHYAALPVFFSISVFFALICGANSFSETRDPVNNGDQSSSDSQIPSDIPVYRSDSEQTLVNPENLSEVDGGEWVDVNETEEFTLGCTETVLNNIDEAFKSLSTAPQKQKAQNIFIKTVIDSIKNDSELQTNLYQHLKILEEAEECYSSGKYESLEELKTSLAESRKRIEGKD